MVAGLQRDAPSHPSPLHPMPSGRGDEAGVSNQAPGRSLDLKSYVGCRSFVFFSARLDFIFPRLNGINLVVFPGDSFHDNHSQLFVPSLTPATVQTPEWYALSSGRPLRLDILESPGMQSSCEKWPEIQARPVHPPLSSPSLRARELSGLLGYFGGQEADL